MQPEGAGNRQEVIPVLQVLPGHWGRQGLGGQQSQLLGVGDPREDPAASS